MTSLGRHTRPACNEVIFSLFSSQSLDNKPPPYSLQPSTLSHSVCFLDLTTLLLIRFRHLFHVWFPFNQTMVKVKFQPLHSMASSIAHNFFRQEANTLSSLCVLMSKGVTSLGPHTRPACNQAPLEIFIKKMIFFTVKLCAYVLFPMRSREQSDDVSHANESRDPQNNTPIVFPAL